MIGEFLELLGISFGFPFFDFQPLKAWHSLHLGTERYMTKPGGATLPFCPEVKGMPSFEWSKSKKGKPQEIPKNSRNSPILSYLFHKKECMISACC